MGKQHAGRGDKEDMEVLDEKEKKKVVKRKKQHGLLSFLEDILYYQFTSSSAYFSFKYKALN